jgi:hypothetical protein
MIHRLISCALFAVRFLKIGVPRSKATSSPNLTLNARMLQRITSIRRKLDEPHLVTTSAIVSVIRNEVHMISSLLNARVARLPFILQATAELAERAPALLLRVARQCFRLSVSTDSFGFCEDCFSRNLLGQ